MILVSKTYCVVTQESAEHGDYAESGIYQDNEPYTFRELVKAMREHYEPSCWPVRTTDQPEHIWFTSGGEQDYATGDETTTSIHYSRDNPPRNRKYWLKAAKAAGIIR